MQQQCASTKFNINNYLNEYFNKSYVIIHQYLYLYIETFIIIDLDKTRFLLF